jgi:hypothetical protein
MNAVSAKTVAYKGSLTVNYKNESVIDDLKLTVEGKGDKTASEVNVKLAFTYDKKDYNLSGSGVYDKDANLYFKVNNVRKLLDSLSTSDTTLPKVFDDIIKKIDGKWVKISAKDMKDVSAESAQTQTCTKNAMKKFQEDKAMATEVAKLYRDNKFITVSEKLGSKDGSLGYVIDGDKAKAKSFDKGFKNTAIYKELKKCDDSFSSNVDSLLTDDPKDSSSGKSRVSVWVSRWSHQLTKLELEGSSDESQGGLVVEPTFNQAVAVTVPKDVTTISELKEDIEKAQQAYIESMYSSLETTSVRTSSSSEL